jgi:hypothetical protein
MTPMQRPNGTTIALWISVAALLGIAVVAFMVS